MGRTSRRRRHLCHLRSVLFAGIAVLGFAPAHAQDSVIALDDVDVTTTRLGGNVPSRPQSAPSRSTAVTSEPRPGPAPATTTVVTPASPPSPGPSGSGIITGTIVTGASSTVITAAEIAASPSHSLQDILSREPGIQVSNPFGGVNGARSQVDMRGFGATAASNTLFLVNGRRITDLDLVGFDLASIPRESIERIEITRGNSGVVLYGDGAVGGVINIITKTGVALPTQARVSGSAGSFKYREGNASFSGSNGPWSTSLYSNAINSDGYRVNNFYRQLNGVGDFRYSANEGSAYLNLSADGSHIGLPGGRLVDPSIGVNELVTDRQGATNRFAWAEKRGKNATLGVTRQLGPGIELIVDGGVRHKSETAGFFGDVNPASSVPSGAVDTNLTTKSFTPRIKIDAALGSLPWRALGGFDYYRAEYHSDRPLFQGASPIHRYDLTQRTLAGYWQQTVTVLPTTDIGMGGRIQGHTILARDKFDPNAPGGSFCFPPFGCFPNGVEGLPLDKGENNRAYHLGFEHRFNPNLTWFGRMAQSFRVPNVDERVGVTTAGGFDPTTFDLRTQKSHDYETGVRVRAGSFDVQWSIYDMYLTDEIMFRFGPNFSFMNINLDPTRRYGHETIAAYRLNDQVRFKGGLAYTRAVFRAGPDSGNDVPLVSRWTGNIGVAWDVWQKYLTFDGIVRYIGQRRMDNDQHNLQPLIPAHTVVDVGFSGEFERLFWSLKVQNLFNADFFDYAIASPFPEGFQSKLNRYFAYPQPGRTYLVKIGATF